LSKVRSTDTVSRHGGPGFSGHWYWCVYLFSTSYQNLGVFPLQQWSKKLTHSCLSGWHGLAAAKTWIELNPSAEIAVLEAESSLGGVWAEHRLYDNLKSNNLLGTYEYSDFPMSEEVFGVKSGQHIPGKVVHEYLKRYSEHFGVYGRIRFRSKVEVLERKDEGWGVTFTQAGEGSKVLLAKKIVVATGLTSQPFLPTFQGTEEFDAPLFHCRDLLAHQPALKKAGGDVVVFGGTKSAWDASYDLATSGLTVHWVIRESGHGPIWMAPPYVTPLKKWLEKLVHTRFLTWFSPCIWGAADGFSGIRNFFHGTRVGRAIVDAFWWVLGNDVLTLNGYDKHDETKKLKPWAPAFWTASSLSILNYPTDFFELVRSGKIRMHIGDITHLEAKTVHLSSGEEIETNALVCSTGWKATPPIKFLPENVNFGLPGNPDIAKKHLIKKADDEILSTLPRLKSQPTINTKYKPLASDDASSTPHPFRLARFMVPPSLLQDRSLVFLGMVQTISTSLIAQTQALWAAAYFSGNLDLKDSNLSKESEDVKYEVILHTQFCKWRYPAGFGKRNPDFVFDAIPYVDMLLNDLGMLRHRKSGRLAEWFEPYGPEDYRGLVEEWKGVMKKVE
jgi:cation diffusion facilitator CzcD-associated flavoprotein CzcO